MKEIMSKIIEYLKKMHSSDPEVSSKRIYGGLIILSTLVWSICKGNTEVINTLIIVAAAMLGVETVERIVRKRSNADEDAG
ncbi:MAG TPA: hypothetical protein P5531_04035 [Bacteroidales bacterium]|nr:hypothetical protein [Bacteroidales bacterium]